MATTLQLRTDIKKLKAAIASKATPKVALPKLKDRLEKAENELAALKAGGKPRKVSTRKGTKTALQSLQALVKKKKSLGVYKGKGVDLKKDAEEGAFAVGRRTSKGLKANQYGTKKQNKGRTYYEYRVNRYDVKQPKPKQKYPKLEDGGMMADGGWIEKPMTGGRKKYIKEVDNYKHEIVASGGKYYVTTTNLSSKSGVDKYSQTFSSEISDDFDTLEQAKNYISKNYQDGGMMAKGGKLSLEAFKKKYDANEDRNYHSENVVLLAENFGTEQDIKDAKTIKAKHDAIGHMPRYLMDERDALSEKLWDKYMAAKKAESEKMEDGGNIVKGKKWIVEYKDSKGDAGYDVLQVVDTKYHSNKYGGGFVVKSEVVESSNKERIGTFSEDSKKYLHDVFSGKYPFAKSLEDGGMMAKGGELVPYIVWVSKDGNKREMHGEYKSQRAAKMAMDKIWKSGADFYEIGMKPKSLYEKEGFYKDGGMTKSEEIKVGDYVMVTNPLWAASLGNDKPVRRKVKMIDGDVLFFSDGSNVGMKYVKKLEDGGMMGYGGEMGHGGIMSNTHRMSN